MIIPILRPGEKLTETYLRKLDRAIQSDGCTDVLDFGERVCCVAHDLAYRYHIDPWGQPISRRGADANLRRCIQAHSRLGRWNPLSWTRWLGVRGFGWAFYPTTPIECQFADQMPQEDAK